MTLILCKHGVWPTIRKFIKLKLIECGFDHGINVALIECGFDQSRCWFTQGINITLLELKKHNNMCVHYFYYLDV